MTIPKSPSIPLYERGKKEILPFSKGESEPALVRLGGIIS
jgi:hypothetical protein